MPNESESAPPAIAVVVVHGVADQGPAESARQIANLLTDLCPLGTYSTFVEEEIRVPIDPIGQGPPVPRVGLFEERNPDAMERHRGRGGAAPPGVTFMRDQLRGFRPAARVFETVRLRGRQNAIGRDVDVYEAYWADLSRPANSLTSFFAQLYQLLLHLPSVGRSALDYARAAHGREHGWRVFSAAHRWSVRCLTLPIVALNLVMATLVLPLIVPLFVQGDSRWVGGISAVLTGGTGGAAPAAVLATAMVQDYQWKLASVAGVMALAALVPAAVALAVFGGLRREQGLLPRTTRVASGTMAAAGALLLLRYAWRLVRAGYQAWPTMGELLPLAVLGLAALIATAYVLRQPRPLPTAVWVLAPITVGIAALTAGMLLSAFYGAVWLLTLEAWVLSALAVWRVLVAYERMRPGARWVGGPALAVAALLIVYAMVRPTMGDLVQQRELVVRAVLVPVQVVNVALALAWRIHVPLLLATVGAGLVCATLTRRRAAWQTLWTVATTLSLSTALFANLTLAAWSALFTGLRRILDGTSTFEPLRVPPVLAELLRLPTQPATVGRYIEQTITASASSTFILITAVLVAFVLVAVWSIFPAAWIESFPPSRPGETARRSRGLGLWLTRGLVLIPAAACVFTLLFVGVVVYAVRAGVPDVASWQAVSAAGMLLLALVGARVWLPGASKVLDVILDVDNYLRHHPEDDNPRSRMAARYASLLRFLVDPARCGRVYERVVIIAHSQGTVITADLLRFLQTDVPDLAAALRARGLTLFTMGSPLRSLYAGAFPWLYEWVWDRHEGVVGPDPAALGVVRWVNAYRSGDYIGRHLWRGDDETRLWHRRSFDPQHEGTPEEVGFNGGRSLEMCLAEGAHTHYWDHHGGDVAWRLDRLIAAGG